jgi:UDP-N-acetyl-2-amino-2-deoxyglucuronate dehydrogenase
MAGFLELQHADVRWFLSVDSNDLPFPAAPGKQTTFRSITVDGAELEFTESFGNLHTNVYRDVLAGGGFGIADARPSIELVHAIRDTPAKPNEEAAHPFVSEARVWR